jgi:ATP-binding cassette subfamily B protein
LLSRKLQNFLEKLWHTVYSLKALQLVWESSPKLALVHVLLLILQSGLSLASIYLTKLVVDALAASISTTNKELAMSQIGLLFGLASASTFISLVCSNLDKWVTQAQGLKLTEYMQGMFHAKAIALDIEYYENTEYYNIVERARKEVQRPVQILYNVTAIAQNALSLSVMLGLLLTIHWVTVPVLVLTTIPTLAAQLKYAKIIYHWQRRQTQVERQLGYLGGIVASANFAKELRLFDLGDYFNQWFLRLQRQFHTEKLAIDQKRMRLYLGSQAIGAVFMLGLYGFMVMQAVYGVLRLGDLAMYHQALQRGKGHLQGLLEGLSNLHEDYLFLCNLYEFLNLEPKLKDPDFPKPVPIPMQKGIVFHQVDFQYSHSTRQALKKIDLAIPPGEVVALVGENGSGKTSLIKLLCRLYEPTAGQITWDGIDLREFKTSDLRRQISVIFQDHMRYDLTVQENIWLGNINLPQVDEQIQLAAKQSGVDAVIQTLPDGYHTWLGKSFHQGEELSGGQWQKIALARAFFRNSQLIVLDEPTSALDPKAEEAVFANFRQLIRGRSAILISHRLSTVKMADRIYVMENGRIVESGTHDELMRRCDRYAHLFELQAKPYRA